MKLSEHIDTSDRRNTRIELNVGPRLHHHEQFSKSVMIALLTSSFPKSLLVLFCRHSSKCSPYRLIAVDLGCCHCLISADVLANVVNLLLFRNAVVTSLAYAEYLKKMVAPGRVILSRAGFVFNLRRKGLNARI